MALGVQLRRNEADGGIFHSEGGVPARGAFPFLEMGMTRGITSQALFLAGLALVLLGIQGCNGAGATDPNLDDEDENPTVVDRHAAIPSDVAKITPAQDQSPPILHSSEFQEPVPLPVISTAGAEDAPFIPAGRDELYFFFAADVRVNPAIQIQNPVNGIWVSKRVGGAWQEPTLVWLQNPGVLALNGCPFVAGDEMYFCTAREGYTGLNWFRAEYADGNWGSWTHYGFDPSLEVGELHIHGDELYYHSGRGGAKGVSTSGWSPVRTARGRIQ